MAEIFNLGSHSELRSSVAIPSSEVMKLLFEGRLEQVLKDDKFPKDKNEKINYRLTFVKYFYTKNIEQILETTQLHKYIFGDLADIYEEATEYDKRKQLCISIDINITILDEINNCLNEIKQEIYPKEKINDTQI
jgi:hypothetical protein